MTQENFDIAYKIQTDIFKWESFKKDIELKIERVFPDSHGANEETPFWWEFAQKFRKKVFSEFENEIDEKINELKKEFEAL